jgi:diaminopimelate epimerase
MKKPNSFIKISATGNDFILFDNRNHGLDGHRDARFFSRLCQHHLAIGADGVILLEASDRADFRYVHINSDGSIAEMCGNGSRAIAWFAHQLGIVQEHASFEINGQIYHAIINGLTVTTEFIPAGEPDCSAVLVEESFLQTGGFIDTGVPHFVIFCLDVQQVDVAGLGKKYRHHPRFARGSNVDFVQVLGPQQLQVRTFERGVEAETLACGTGAVASVLISSTKKNIVSPCSVQFPGGQVSVEFSADFQRIAFTGLVTPVFHGIIEDSFYA